MERQATYDSGETTDDNDAAARVTWGFLDSIEDLMTVQDMGDRSIDALQTVDITVDSGAAEVVAPPSFAPDSSVKASV